MASKRTRAHSEKNQSNLEAGQLRKVQDAARQRRQVAQQRQPVLAHRLRSVGEGGSASVPCDGRLASLAGARCRSCEPVHATPGRQTLPTATLEEPPHQS